MTPKEMIDLAVESGFAGAEVIGTEQIVFDPMFRPFCEENLCGQYGANHSCPPDIKIRGVRELHGTTYSVIPDQIEAGTFMAAAAATRSNILIKNVIPKHLEPITNKLLKIGVQVEQYDDSIRVIGGDNYVGTTIKTHPHPGFPTDMQPQMSAVLTCAKRSEERRVGKECGS